MKKELKVRTKAIPFDTMPATAKAVLQALAADGIQRSTLTFSVDEAPPTVNHMYRHTQRGTYLTKETQKFRLDVLYSIAASRQKFVCTGTIAMMIFLESPYWVTKKSTIREMDCDNRIKPIIDAIKLAVNIPDETVWELHVYKMPSKRTRTTVHMLDLGDIVDICS